MGATDNANVVERGLRKAKEIIDRELIAVGYNIAVSAVKEATSNYKREEASLTGNLLNSIGAGVYMNKHLVKMVTTDEKAATHTYTRVGDGGFLDYDTGDRVDFVKQYAGGKLKFQWERKGGDGLNGLMTMLSSYRPESEGLEIVVFAAARYAGYLQSVRGLDVLTSAKVESEKWFYRRVESALVKAKIKLK